MQGYLTALRERLAEIGLQVPIQVMRSDGGTMAADGAAERPIYVVGSGPAAGVTASRHFASTVGLTDVIAFDMGGTTAKASVIEGGRFSISNEYEIRGGLTAPSRFIKAGGYLMMVPTIDLAEIGNGAGSIARVDAGGALRVGPQSAGAHPGPVCYALGGKEPTITDANVVLGLLNPDSLLGGALRIDSEKALVAVRDRIGTPLGLDTLDAAYGIYAIANSNMLRALRSVTTERGRDPRGFNLCAFGGSGPVHVAALAAELGIPTVLVPPLAGLFSAFGLLASAVEHQYSRTWIRPLADVAADQLADRFKDLERLASEAMSTEGYPRERVELARLADLRYAGQSSVLTVSLGVQDWNVAKDSLETRFAEEHERTYGHRLLREPVELVGLRVVATAQSNASPAMTMPNGRGANHAPDRKVYWGPNMGHMSVPVLQRHDLDLNWRDGPLIIEEYDTTIIVRPTDRVRMHKENIVIGVAQ
jgi:N-methylhydantoinase A